AARRPGVRLSKFSRRESAHRAHRLRFPRIAARADGACMTAAARKPAARPSVLEAFTLRCWARAQRYAVGEIGLHDAIDELQRAAEASGLIAELGQDEVQRL